MHALGGGKGGLVLDGDGASERFCKTGCDDYGLIHFATHGELNRLNPLFSHVQLEPGQGEDGRFEVLEVMGLDLEADLVTLSACNTALGAGYFSQVPAGDDWVGLTRAFLYAGTPTVVASLWEVDDEHTARMMSRFYHYLAAGESKGAALTRVKRDCLAGKDGLSPHPYFWAPFVLIGDWK